MYILAPKSTELRHAKKVDMIVAGHNIAPTPAPPLPQFISSWERTVVAWHCHHPLLSSHFRQYPPLTAHYSLLSTHSHTRSTLTTTPMQVAAKLFLSKQMEQ